MIKTFRLFVSSTFKDLNEERALLHDKVFPELESHCGLHGFGFRAIDTRWGVNEDAQLNQRAAEICLAEVRDAKTYPAPNLLILIGERYGWVPLPHAIAEDEYEAIHHWLASQSPTGRAAMLDRVYEYDGNHVIEQGLQLQPGVLVGAYTLRPRERASRNAEVWTRIEQDARMALQAGAHFLHGSGRLDDAGRDKYFLSLTEQEIRAGVESLTQPIAVRDGQPVAWIRARSNAEPAIQSLAADLKRALPVTKVLGARADIDGALSPAYRKAFVREVGTCLKAAIDRQINAARVRSQEPDFALNVERQAHDAFAAERLRVFVGREITRSVFTRHIEGSARHPLVLYGVSGSGKSALIAKAAAEASVGSFRVVKRFVRANAASSNQRLLLFSRIEDSPQPVLLRCRRNGQTTPTVSLMRLGMRLAPSPSLWQGRACAPAAEQLRKPWTPSGLTSSFITKNAAFLGNWTRCDCK